MSAFEALYRPAIDELASLARPRDLPQEAHAALEENLAIVDRAIAESRGAVARDPHPERALARFEGMYDAKVRALRTVAFVPTHPQHRRGGLDRP